MLLLPSTAVNSQQDLESLVITDERTSDIAFQVLGSENLD